MKTLKQISHEELREKLRNSIVRFYFKKLDGTLRIAVGTVKLNEIPLEKHPKGIRKPSKVTVFYDLEKNDWRSVSESKEVWVDK